MQPETAIQCLIVAIALRTAWHDGRRCCVALGNLDLPSRGAGAPMTSHHFKQAARRFCIALGLTGLTLYWVWLP